MNGQILLADYAKVSDDKVDAFGLGWTVTSAPTPPMAVILIVDIPWDRTNQPQDLQVTLLDADGHPVVIGQDQSGNPAHIKFAAQVEAGRPPGLPAGSSQRTPAAIGLDPGIPLAPGAAYEWRLEINGEHREGWSAFFQTRP